MIWQDAYKQERGLLERQLRIIEPMIRGKFRLVSRVTKEGKGQYRVWDAVHDDYLDRTWRTYRAVDAQLWAIRRAARTNASYLGVAR